MVIIEPPILSQVFFRTPGFLPPALIAATLTLALVVWFYGPQVRGMSRPFRWLIPTLRALAILALGASLLKPVATRLTSASERGEVLVLLDRSESMNVVDNRRTHSQLVALADALGYLSPETRNDTGGQFISALERLAPLAAEVKSAQDDLDYARISGHEIETRVEHLHQAVDRYGNVSKNLLRRSESLPTDSELRRLVTELAQVPAPDARDAWKTEVPARIRQAVAAAAQFQDASDAELYQLNPQVQEAADQVARQSRDELVQRALMRPGGILGRLTDGPAVDAFAIAEHPVPLVLNPDAFAQSMPGNYATNLTGSISRAVAGRKVRAIVLFSDGRQIGADAAIAPGLVPDGVPVFTVAAADSTPPRDLSFADVKVPSSVFAGQPFSVRVELRHEGFAGIDVKVHLQTDEEAQQTRQVSLRQGRRATTTFPVRLTRPGVQRMKLWIDPVEGEITTLNNQVEPWLKVAPQRMKVLLVAGSPGWDFQFARNVLAKSAEVDLKDQVLNPSSPKLQFNPAQIRQQDVVVLFDVPIKALDAAQWDAVEQLAERWGGSVVLVAGGVHLPAEYGKSAPISVSHLLPYDVVSYLPAWRVWPGESPQFQFIPTPQGQLLPALRWGEETEQGVSRWEQLPGCYRFVQLPDRHGEGWRRNVRTLLMESESGLPVLTEMRLGVGRAFFLGINETWRWGAKRGERDLDRFWRELIAYSADQPYFVRTEALALDADKVAAEPNEPIHIRARINDEQVGMAKASEAQVLGKGRVVETVALAHAGPVGSGRLTGTVSLPSGDYELRWTVQQGRRPLSIHMPLHVAASDQAEMADLSGDERMLRRLAETTGGEFLRLEQVNSLPARLAAAGDLRFRFAEMSLWDSPYLFGFVVGCLGIEWALRKRVGLA